MKQVFVIALLAAMLVGTLAEEVKMTPSSCPNYVCPTEYGFFKRIAEWNDAANACICVPYYTEGPCKVGIVNCFPARWKLSFCVGVIGTCFDILLQI